MDPARGIDALIDRMEGLLAPLEARGDPGRYFLATYLRTTRAVEEELERGSFRDTGWVARWDVAFADLYLDALEAAEAGRRPPEPWAVAFGAAAQDRSRRYARLRDVSSAQVPHLLDVEVTSALGNTRRFWAGC